MYLLLVVTWNGVTEMINGINHWTSEQFLTSTDV